MEAITITLYPSDTAQIEAIKATMKAFKIKFEIKTEKPYNPQYVAKIKKSRQEYKDGNFITVEKENLKSFLGLE
jgi:hypothetical protein